MPARFLLGKVVVDDCFNLTIEVKISTSFAREILECLAESDQPHNLQQQANDLYVNDVPATICLFGDIIVYCVRF